MSRDSQLREIKRHLEDASAIATDMGQRDCNDGLSIDDNPFREFGAEDVAFTAWHNGHVDQQRRNRQAAYQKQRAQNG